MLKVLFKDPFNSMGKLVALCFVMYLATISFFVAGFLALLAARWLHKQMLLKAKAIEAADADAEAARAEAEKLAAAARTAEAVKAASVASAASVATATAAANDAAVEPAARVYAKSAVVIPFRTGTE